MWRAVDFLIAVVTEPPRPCIQTERCELFRNESFVTSRREGERDIFRNTDQRPNKTILLLFFASLYARQAEPPLHGS
jgi:hypothetical protein